MPLFADEDFLKGVRAEDLMVERIEEAPSEMVKEIEDAGFDYWFGKTLFSVYSPDSLLLAEIVSNRGLNNGIRLIYRKTKKEVKFIIGGYNIHWSPNGKFLAYDKMVPCKELYHGRQTYQDGGRWIYNINENKEERIPISDYYDWSPKANLLAGNQYYGDSLKFVLYDPSTAETRLLDKTLFFDFWNFSWSPDGNMLVYVVATKVEGNVELSPIESDVFVINRDGTGKMQITHTPEPEISVKWLPDGKSIVVERFKQTPDLANGGGSTEIVILKLTKREKK